MRAPLLYSTEDCSVCIAALAVNGVAAGKKKAAVTTEAGTLASENTSEAAATEQESGCGVEFSIQDPGSKILGKPAF